MARLVSFSKTVILAIFSKSDFWGTGGHLRGPICVLREDAPLNSAKVVPRVFYMSLCGSGAIIKLT